MRTHRVKMHWDNACKALAKFQQHINCADAEALVSGHSCRIGLMRCRDMASLLSGLMLDMRWDIERIERERKEAHRQLMLRAKRAKRCSVSHDKQGPRP